MRSRVDTDRPIFVCGVGRSGTSLLQSMLHGHPDVAMTPETHFFRRYVTNARRRRRIEAAGPGHLVALLSQDEDFRRAGLSPEVLLEEEGLDLDLTRVYRRLLEHYGARLDVERVGDKDPRNVEHLETLHGLFPGATVLHVIRDPRDVLLSRTRAAWSAHRPWWLQTMVCREQLRHGREAGARCFGDRYVEVRYEELVDDPERCLRQVCERASLEWHPALLEFAGPAGTLVDRSELAWKQETLGPLLPKNTGKWKGALSPVQIRLTEEVARESFEELGYDRSDEAVPDVRGRLAVAGAPLLRAAAPLLYELRRFAEGAR